MMLSMVAHKDLRCFCRRGAERFGIIPFQYTVIASGLGTDAGSQCARNRIIPFLESQWLQGISHCTHICLYPCKRIIKIQLST